MPASASPSTALLVSQRLPSSCFYNVFLEFGRVLCGKSLLIYFNIKVGEGPILLLYSDQIRSIFTMTTRQRRKSIAEEIDLAVTSAVKDAGAKIQEALVVLWDDLPSWQQDNQYILSGYRPASGSFAKSFASLTYLHNESVNIFSHLIPAIGFILLAFALLRIIVPRYDTITQGDLLAFACFFAGAAICLGMSATYHAISNHSPLVARFGNKLDYIGIVFLITGSFIPSIYYGFYCHPHLQELYWTMVSSPHFAFGADRMLTIYVDMLVGLGLCNGLYF